MTALDSRSERVPRSRRAVFVIATSFALCAASAVHAQDPARAFFEPVEVPLVSVDVYVTDGDGRPVPGLTLDDFEIYEDGTRIQPTHFYAAPAARPQESDETAAPPTDVEVLPSPTDQLLLAVWIDETGLRPERRRTALEHLKEFLTVQLPEDVRVALVSYDGSPRVRLSFTDDRDRVAAGLEEVILQGASVSRLDEEQVILRRIQNTAASTVTMGTMGVEVQSSDLLAEIQAYAARAHQEASLALGSLGDFIGSLAVLPGQKIVLVVSDGLDIRPGERLFTELQRVLGEASGVAGLSAFNFGRRYDLTRELRQLLRRANTNRVTFMTLSAMAERNLRLTSAESRGGSGADLDQMMTEEQAMLTMAGVTGGRVLENSGVLTTQLEQVAEEVAAYYSVGYPPPTPGDGTYHRLEIRVRRDGVDVRHREGYVGTGPADSLIEETMAAALLDLADNPLGVSVELRPVEARDDDTYLVPVLVRIPIGSLVLVPGEAAHEGRISLVVVVQSADGGMSEPELREYPVVVPNDELVRATASDAGYTLGLVMRPGPHRIAVGVEDEMAGATATEVTRVDVGSAG